MAEGAGDDDSALGSSGLGCSTDEGASAGFCSSFFSEVAGGGGWGAADSVVVVASVASDGFVATGAAFF